MEQLLLKLLAGADRFPAREGGGLELRLLSAQELLEARHEAAQMATDDSERALIANACLLKRVLWKRGKPVFHTGEAVLAGLTAEQIGSLAGQWAKLNRQENPSAEDGEERVNAIKKAWSTRLMNALSGACSKLLVHFRPKNEPEE